MANAKLTALTALTAPALADQVYIVDTSDTTDDAAGTSKRILLSDLIKAIGGKVPLQTITLGSAGEFDFDSIPSGYKRLVIEGQVRSSAADSLDTLYLLFNGDTTTGNYLVQLVQGFNNAGQFTKGLNPDVGAVSANTAPANAYTSVRVGVENYAGSAIKSATVAVITMQTTVLAANAITAIFNPSITAAITRLRLRANGHPTDGLIGTLTLYGEL